MSSIASCSVSANPASPPTRPNATDQALEVRRLIGTANLSAATILAKLDGIHPEISAMGGIAGADHLNFTLMESVDGLADLHRKLNLISEALGG